MRAYRYFIFILLYFFSGSIITYGQEAPKASLRVRGEGTSSEQLYMEIGLPKPYKPTPSPIVTVYTKGIGKKLPITPYTDFELQENPNLAKQFRIFLPQGADPNANYALTLQYTDVDDQTQDLSIVKLEPDYEIEVRTNDPNCREQFSFNIVFTTRDKRYRDERIARIHEWLSKPPQKVISQLKFEPLSQEDVLDKRIIESLLNPTDVNKAKEDGGVSYCLKTSPGLPYEPYDAKVSFSEGSPLEFRKPLFSSNLPPRTRVVPAKADIDPRNAGARPLERNLDLGIVFSSAVTDVKNGNQTVRQRDNTGVLDLLFAPFLNNTRGSIKLRLEELKDQRGAGSTSSGTSYDLVTFWTPIYFDAKVSTKPITKDNLSLNTVVIGTEREWRWFASTDKKFDNIFRLITRASNASDRDFKRAEYKFSADFIPLFAFINQPIKDRSLFVTNELDPTRVKEIPAIFGWEVKPLIGAEFGRTYTRGRPAEDLAKLPKQTVKRIYFGLDIIFNVKSLTLSLNDRFYIRGESKTDRKQNYFLGQLDFPLTDSSNENIAQSIFLAFERGKLPPFNKVGVNAFKIGYRIRSQGWFDRFR